MAKLGKNAKKNAKKIKLLAFDVDGVMTDGSITYDENGVEYKTFNVKDGQGLVRMVKSGFITAIITARQNGTVQHRAENLNITEIYQGQKYKLPALEEIMKKHNLNFENVAYMGDDLPDLCILENEAELSFFDQNEKIIRFLLHLLKCKWRKGCSKGTL